MFDKKYLASSSVIFVNTSCLVFIPQLNNNNIRYDGIIYNGSINADSEYFNNPNKDIYYHLLANTDNNSIIGFPTGVYAYGVLITFSGSAAFDNYAKCQIYIFLTVKENL